MTDKEIKDRIKDVIRIDATLPTEADFMMTHMPFNKLANYKQDIHSGSAHNLIREDEYADVPRFSEDAVLDDLLSNDEQHKFFMIIGRNGIGKSHLIRWLYYQIKKNIEENNNETEKTIFIPRANNNIKEALKLIINSGILPEKQKEYYSNKIDKGTTNISEGEMIDTLLSNLAIKVDHDENALISEVKRKKLNDFLSNKTLQNKYLKYENGPIDNLYSTLLGKAGFTSDGEPFKEEMFTKNQAAIMELNKDDVSPELRRFVMDLSRDNALRSEIIRYLNSIATNVIERTSSISASDIHGIFEEIRKELKVLGKKLTVFVEDINIYKGVDSALIESLIQEHTEENGLCRIRSVVGSTDRYFDDYFNDALKDRMTRKIVILDKTLLEDKTKMVEFTARYVNAIHFSKEEVEKWYKNGDDMPTWDSGYEFGKITIGGKEFPIFPFSENAIFNLFESLNDKDKSPRGLLKSIIKPINELWYEEKEHIIDSRQRIRGIDGINRINNFEPSDKNAFDAKNYADSERRELLFLIWGDRTFTEKDGKIGGITDEMFELFKVKKDGDIASSIPGEIVESVSPVVIQEKDEILKNSLDKITDWETDPSKEFTLHKPARDLISKFIIKNINFEKEDIPHSFASEFFSKIQNYEIEGQDSPNGSAPIKITRSKLSGQMLRALFTQDAQKNSKNAWDFVGGPDQEIFAKTWLLKNKNNIVSIVKEKLIQEQKLEFLAVEAKIANLIGLGLLEKTDDNYIFDSVVRLNSEEKLATQHLEDERWENIKRYFAVNEETINKSFNLIFLNTIGSTKPDAENIKYVIIDAVELMNNIIAAREDLTSKKHRKEIKSVDGRIQIMSQGVTLFEEEIENCLKDMHSFAKDQIKKYEDWFGDGVTSERVYNTFKEMKNYLSYIKHEANMIYPAKYIDFLDENDISDEVKYHFEKLSSFISKNDIISNYALCGNINTFRINQITELINDFEKFIDDKNGVFNKGINHTTNGQIVSISNDIRRLINDCMDCGKDE